MKCLQTAATFAALLTIGCATSYHGLKTERGSGTSQSFAGTSENAWRACLLALHELGLELKELDPERQYVIAAQDSNLRSAGEHVGCFVGDDTIPDRTSVEIVSLRVMASNAFAIDWSEDTLWMVGLHLSRLEASEPGPWLRAAEVDACVARGLEVAREANLEFSWDEKQRCRKDAQGSSEAEAACLAERKRLREGWLAYADPALVVACLDGQPADRGTD